MPTNYAKSNAENDRAFRRHSQRVTSEEIPHALATLDENLQNQDNKQVDKRKTQNYQPEPAYKKQEPFHSKNSLKKPSKNAARFYGLSK